MMSVIIIGVEPPCPRCERLETLARDALRDWVQRLKSQKISYDSDEAQQLGRVGTAHDIADWSDMQMDWGRIRDIVADGWSHELDDFLMPCKVKADELGWLMTPVLVIDDEIVFSGFVPEPEAVISAITNKLNRER